MSTTPAELEAEKTEPADAVSLVLGAVAVFAGAFVFFAASPVMPVEPTLEITSAEPVSVVANMAVGASTMVAGAEVSASSLDKLW